MARYDSTAPDGREWQVFRRRLAWRPRLPRWVRERLPGVLDGSSQLGPFAALVAVPALVIALPWLVWHALSWVLSLLVTPVVMPVRPVVVVARLREFKHAEWRGEAAGRVEAESLIGQVRREIMLHGAPRSLTAPDAATPAEIDGTTS